VDPSAALAAGLPQGGPRTGNNPGGRLYRGSPSVMRAESLAQLDAAAGNSGIYDSQRRQASSVRDVHAALLEALSIRGLGGSAATPSSIALQTIKLRKSWTQLVKSAALDEHSAEKRALAEVRMKESQEVANKRVSACFNSLSALGTVRTMENAVGARQLGPALTRRFAKEKLKFESWEAKRENLAREQQEKWDRAVVAVSDVIEYESEALGDYLQEDKTPVQVRGRGTFADLLATMPKVPTLAPRAAPPVWSAATANTSSPGDLPPFEEMHTLNFRKYQPMAKFSRLKEKVEGVIATFQELQEAVDQQKHAGGGKPSRRRGQSAAAQAFALKRMLGIEGHGLYSESADPLAATDPIRRRPSGGVHGLQRPHPHAAPGPVYPEHPDFDDVLTVTRPLSADRARLPALDSRRG
jgi:hypothetical protein